MPTPPPPPPPEPSRPPSRRPASNLGWVGIAVWVALVLAVGFIVIQGDTGGGDTKEDLTYSAFLALIDDDGIRSVKIDPDGHASGELASGDRYTTQLPT